MVTPIHHGISSVESWRCGETRSEPDTRGPNLAIAAIVPQTAESLGSSPLEDSTPA